MRREIVLLGDEVLRRKAKPVSAVDGSVRKLVDDMVDTMKAADGLGLAAPQVGVAKRVFVARDDDQLLVLINPLIVRRRGHETGVEGCLSMPGLQGNVSRAKSVIVSGLDRSGRQVTYEVEGLTARCFQHEIDHLNGVLFTDHTRDLWWVEYVPGETEDDERVVRTPTNIAEITQHFAAQRGAAQPRAHAEVA